MTSDRIFHHLSAEAPIKEPQFTHFPSRRSVVYSAKGMVACSQPLAAEAGLEILRKGGNAADAAVAVSAMLALCEPVMCGLGGDAFLLYYDAKTKAVKGLNGSGRAPKALDLAKARSLGIRGRHISPNNLNSATVPGCIAAYVDTLELFGSGKVTLKDVLDPAIRSAETGVPISEITSYLWEESASLLLSQSPSGPEMLVVDPKTGKPHAPKPGEIFKNPTFAKTLREVVEKGKKGFYEGRIAQAIVDLIQSKGGVMTLEDLASHTSTPVTPISYLYGGSNGVTLHECPPNGQGLIALIALGIVEAIEESGAVDLQSEPHNSTLYLHTLIEAMRLAFADGRAYISDPEVSRVPVEELLSKEYLRSRAKLFDPASALPNHAQGNPLKSSDTVLFTTADEEGNACSFIQSNYSGFGTHAVPEDCGFTLQNRGTNFDLEKGHPNCVEGGKRPYHTIIPAMVTKGDKPGGDVFMTYGVMGGFNQPQGQLQVLLNALHHGFTPQSALDAPRFCISGEVRNGSVNSDVFLEEGIAPEVIEDLQRMGHNVQVMSGYDRNVFGKGQVIQRLEGGVWAGGSDPRADGQAVPQI